VQKEPIGTNASLVTTESENLPHVGSCTFLLAVRTGAATLAVKQVLNCYCLMLTAAATGVMVTLLPLSGRIWYYEAGRDDKKMGFLFRKKDLYLNLEITHLIQRKRSLY
jgi:hypothetical protein